MTQSFTESYRYSISLYPFAKTHQSNTGNDVMRQRGLTTRLAKTSAACDKKIGSAE